MFSFKSLVLFVVLKFDEFFNITNRCADEIYNFMSFCFAFDE